MHPAAGESGLVKNLVAIRHLIIILMVDMKHPLIIRSAGNIVIFTKIHLVGILATLAFFSPRLLAQDSWVSLFNGTNLNGWRSAKSENFPAYGWIINDGVLTVHDNKGEESAGGGDIITRKRYSDFELNADFKLTPGANSGIKIFVQPDISPIDKKTGVKTAVGSAIGMEFQVLDDALHPDAKLGKNGDRTIGSLYDLMPAPKDKKVLPIGEWNSARILSRGKHVEFWLNGQKTVAFERGSEDFRAHVAESKFKNIPNFGEWADGHILLQEHGNEVSFRNVKIRVLSAK